MKRPLLRRWGHYLIPVAMGLVVGGCAGDPWAHGAMMGTYSGHYARATGVSPGTSGFGPGCMYGAGPPAACWPAAELNQQEKQQLHDVQQKLYQSQLDNRQELDRAMEEWHSALDRPDPDVDAAAEANDRILSIQQDMLKNRVDAQTRMHQILSSPR